MQIDSYERSIHVAEKQKCGDEIVTALPGENYALRRKRTPPITPKADSNSGKAAGTGTGLA